MRANVYSIPLRSPFLRTLADGLLSGRLDVGYRHDGDPLSLADVLIYVPSRRAARALAIAFQDRLGGQAAILPQIRTIGEGEEAELLQGADPAMALQPIMGELERRLELARLVRRWRTMTREAELKALVGEDVILPASAADALHLAGDLGVLLDEIETEGVAFSQLSELAPDDLAEWWRLTLTFLTIVTRHWPDRLEADGRISGARAKNEWLRSEVERLRTHPPAGPVIIAGSTATAPQTIALMRTIARMDRGAVVLPGLDMHLSEAAFATIDRTVSIASPGHPQYGVKRILSGMMIERGSVAELAATDDRLAIRERFLSDALRPAETTEHWSGSAASYGDDALEGLELVEAADPREEALAIACAMRDALCEEAASCALVTPDRNLARRVVIELERFAIRANDSAGRPLKATAPGTLAATLLSVAFAPGDPIPLLALLKHPLVRLGMASGEARRAARAIELLALRGTVEIADAARLSTIVGERLLALAEQGEPEIGGAPGGGERGGVRLSRPARLVSGADRELALLYAARFEAAIAPLIALRGDDPRELPDYARILTQVLEALDRDESGRAHELYAEEAGHAFQAFMSDLVDAPRTDFAFASGELEDVIDALMTGVTVRPRGGLSARAFVWGTLEARLQSVDTVILGGLNEGTWPAGARSGAFLSRMMRRDIALDPPERRIGLAAHDFWMAMGARRVILTRSLRQDGAPTIAARWIQRIAALAGPRRSEALARRGSVYLEAARGLEAAEPVARAVRPEPRPPVELRPRGYSVTEVERLIRDPYAVHARRIMKLEPLDPLMRSPDAMERGTLYHAILADFATSGNDPMADTALQTLLDIARTHFDTEALPPDIEAFWWPRMEAIAKGYLEWERARDPRIAVRHAEIGGGLDFPAIKTRLTGKADRLDVMTDGAIHIVDFKTGAGPSLAQVRSLLSPQLPLEGGMVLRGGFELCKDATRLHDLSYVRLREREVYEESLARAATKTSEGSDPTELSQRAIEKFERLAASFLDPATPFTSRFRPAFAGDFSGDYDHLARAREWAVAGGTSEGASDE
ncbi:double-strand break repair protein AddB [Fulvimarina sp. 2208YS6-2-32]|uniref:Double-strand break repair protein AddB n=1 Tax=Fulvimarina uroteuthidis TaxID=3098149 RepID=A0ABU5HZN9_9HYPH|nr:double-strand break repair protein AddB [Fulvimarina sp. 2208YS6-2-32]MDY8108327.1 double-strand break repair protein AddB [Fulvimarina sp. 2208YS6-2-32]